MGAVAGERGTPAPARKRAAPDSEAGRAASPGGGAAEELAALSEAIESGAGLPAVARAAAAALGASVALIDRSSAVLAVAAASPSEEEKLLAVEGGVEVSDLRVADAVVGQLRFRARGGGEVPASTVRMVATLLGLEMERARAPEWAGEEAARDFVHAVLERRLADPADIGARAAELGTDLSAGGGVVYLRAHPHAAQAGDWRARVLMLTLRTSRAAGPGAVAAASEGEPGEACEVAAIVPTDAAEQISRAAGEVGAELASAMSGFTVTIGFSRHAAGPAELYRAGKEALLAVNVGEAEGRSPLAFEETGSYRLLLPAMSEDPEELERFYAETVAPLSAYDEQYETELVATVEAYLENNGSVTPTAESLFTHRHTVRYRLERVKELAGHDLSSTEGREKLGLGLKAMRVLGIPAPRGPALEPGGRAGKVKRKSAEE
jgi:DNA-binding PucR family transcriptional regulator